MKVWVLSVGEYSNYQVVGVFDEEHLDKAIEFSKLINGRVDGFDDFPGGPIELNEIPKHENPPNGLNYYVVEMKRGGKVSYYPRSNSQLDYDYNGFKLHNCYYRLAKAHTTWILLVGNYAKSREHAVEMAKSIYTKVISKEIPEQAGLVLGTIDIVKKELGDKK
jgi:hypothetical protein